MEIHYRKSIREARKTRTAAYCRVSTSRIDQEESFELQTKYYEECIRSNPDWEFAGIYSDLGISGTDAKKRPGFQKLVQDALGGEVDLILVKSISRFSRNIIDCRNYAEMLHSHGVEIRFEKEGISTNDPSAFLMFGLMATIAQSESESISKNIRWSCQKRFEKGEYNLGTGRILGYSTAHGKAVPNKDAWMIKMIFDRFLAGDSYMEISRKVAEAGGHTMRGDKALTISSIQRILTNETYVGDKLLQKRPPKNFLTHKPDPDAEYDSYYVTDGHEAIIDRDTWDRVQKKLEERKAERENGVCRIDGKSHFLYGKVICGSCGALYRRRSVGSGAGKHKVWVCSDRLKGKKGNGCRNRYLDESQLLQAISEELGWEWKGRESFNAAAFADLVEQIVVLEDRLEIVKKS